MSRPAAYTDGSTYPTYVTRAHDRDTDWTRQARCLGLSSNPESPWYNAWFAEAGKKVKIGATSVDGDELIEVALGFCMHCPVQWDCATWALDVQEPQGTWAMPLDDLRYLRSNFDDPVAQIDKARQREEPVQVFMKRLRADATSAA